MEMGILYDAVRNGIVVISLRAILKMIQSFIFFIPYSLTQEVLLLLTASKERI